MDTVVIPINGTYVPRRPAGGFWVYYMSQIIKGRHMPLIPQTFAHRINIGVTPPNPTLTRYGVLFNDLL